MNTNTAEGSFIAYPTNRVVGTIADAEQVDAAVAALVNAGFERESIDVLHGEDDLNRLDPDGTQHGILERLQRALVRTGGPAEEHRHLLHHADDLRAGRFVVMVLAPERERRTLAGDILDAHGAEFVGFYGRWAWTGRPASERRPAAHHTATSDARAVTPEDVPRLFVEAWNRRDADALASLFDLDAEFVNVTGLWWHDRASIRKAHAYGLERIFNESTLGIDHLRVKRLADDIALVHAKMTLTGQSAVASIAHPGARTTIFSFIVHREAEQWTCASAHNTDVVPNMETNVVSDDGTFRAANYHSGHVS